MPNPLQGDIRWYDFGPVCGTELSGHRPAPVLSNDSINRQLAVAIAVPTSTSMPPEPYRSRHVFIARTTSWASTGQLKAVSKERLGDLLGTASQGELTEAFHAVAHTLTGSDPAGYIRTTQGPEIIHSGTFWQPDVAAPAQNIPSPILVLSYNAGNNLAVACEVALTPPAPNSQVAILINIPGRDVPASAFAHRIRCIDMSRHNFISAGRVAPDDLSKVVSLLLWMIDPSPTTNE